MVETTLSLSTVDQYSTKYGPYHTELANKENYFELATSVCFNMTLFNLTKISKIGLRGSKEGQRRKITVTLNSQEESIAIEKVTQITYRSLVVDCN